MEGTNEKKSILNIYANRGHFSKTKTAFIASRKLSDKWVLYILFLFERNIKYAQPGNKNA